MYAVADDLTDIVNFMVFVASPRRRGAPGGRGVQAATEKLLWRPPQGKWRRLGAIWRRATAKRAEARRGGRHSSADVLPREKQSRGGKQSRGAGK